MKKYPAVISAAVLVAMRMCELRSELDKGANLSSAAGPELRWKYETGG